MCKLELAKQASECGPLTSQVLLDGSPPVALEQTLQDHELVVSSVAWQEAKEVRNLWKGHCPVSKQRLNQVTFGKRQIF